ncbi:MAG: proline iminopeptidase, partial [Myxococcota bacterium]
MTMLLLLTLLAGCRDASEVNDHFFVRSGDALLPVQVRGNTTRGVLILFESGGPSGPGIAERMVGSMQFAEGLEAEVALAFYDRRGVGNAQGDYAPEDLTMAHALDDLDAVLAVLDDQYAPDHVVLMGHSWGGFVTARYLLDGPRTVDAW